MVGFIIPVDVCLAGLLMGYLDLTLLVALEHKAADEEVELV